MRSSIAIALLVLSACMPRPKPRRPPIAISFSPPSAPAPCRRRSIEAAARGFRVVAASPSDGSEAIVLLEQTKDKYQYRLLAATRTGTLQREISDAAEAGYRIVPRAVVRKGDELLVLLEKGAEGPAKARYLVLATERTGTLQKEISQASIDGYTLVALASRGEHVAILERGPR